MQYQVLADKANLNGQTIFFVVDTRVRGTTIVGGRLSYCCEVANALISALLYTSTPETSGHIVNSRSTMYQNIGGVCGPDFAIVWQSGRGGYSVELIWFFYRNSISRYMTTFLA